MKKSLIILIFSTLTCLSCSDNFLDLSPKNQANINDFYTSENDFEVALTGAYGTLMGGRFADQLQILFDMRTDNAFALANNRNHQIVSEFTLSASFGVTSSFYDNSYRGIQAANAIINRIDGIEMSENTRNRIKGEALFLRALRYFYMIQIYGDVPLILTETSGANLGETQLIPRTPVDEVYDQIITDLKEAESILPSSFDTPNKASVMATKSLLGKVYLFRKNYNEASSKLAEVVGNFSLIDNYEELYEVGNSNNEESIFAIQHIGSADGTGSSLGFQMNPSGTQLGGYNIVNQAYYVEEEFYKLFDSLDDRRNMTAQAFLANPTDEFGGTIVYYCKKYVDESPFDGGNASNTAYIIRYADVLLMRAEALNETNYVADGEAFLHLNEIRTRAGLSSLNSADIPNQSAFREALILERRKELAFEGHRWMDLLRTGTAISVINAYVSGSGVNPQITEKDLLYPIPEGEVLGNPDVITQNPGY